MVNLIKTEYLSDELKDTVSDKPIAVEPETPMKEVFQLMKREKSDYILVVHDDWIVGILTEKDILRIGSKEEDFTEQPVKKYMSKNPETLEGESPVAAAIYLMLQGGYRHMPLVDGSGKPFAVFTSHDLIESLVAYYDRSSPESTSRED